MLIIQNSINNEESFNSNYWGFLGVIFIGLGDYDKTKAFSSKMLEETGFTFCFGMWNISSVLFAQGKNNEAISFIDSICSNAPSVCDLACKRQLAWNQALLG